MKFAILSDKLLAAFRAKISASPLDWMSSIDSQEISVDSFQFYKSVSSVYSSKIEGEEIDFDSYFKHKFLNVEFKPDYTKKSDDLFKAYEFIETKELNLKNVQETHSILSASLLPKSQQGLIRTSPMFVINEADRIEYVATEPDKVNEELQKLFEDIDQLKILELDAVSVFYFASFIHLVFVKIHPFLDGNGRIARLIEKWFLMEFFGDKAQQISLEKNYYRNLSTYYSNIKNLGIEYENLDYEKAFPFLLMTIDGLESQSKEN